MAPPIQRRATQQPAAHADQVKIHVHELNPPPRLNKPNQSPCRLIVVAILLAVLAMREVVRFCTSRCHLIDWSASTSLMAVPMVTTQVQLDRHISAHEPALLHGVLHQWPAVRKWSPAWFGDALGSTGVEVFFWGRSGADWRRTRVFGLQLSQYAKLLQVHAERAKRLGAARAGPAPYLQEDESLFAEHEALLLPDVQHLPFRPYLRRQAADGAPPDEKGAAAAAAGIETETAFWMGPANARTGIHWDSVDAILHQLHGTKRLTLWPPSARPDLYPSPKYNHGAELSLVDAAAPNHTRFPRYAHAKSLEVTLPAGSALYLPAGWWHAVTSLDTTISLALRSQSACERRAAVVDDVLQWLHNRGWYKRGNCVCHRGHAAEGGEGGEGAAADGEDEDDGLSEAIDELLQAAGVDVHHAKAAVHEPGIEGGASRAEEDDVDEEQVQEAGEK